MTCVIGDIHGNYEKLRQLLKYIPSKEKLICIGDYIDKGKQSKEVINYLITLSQKRQIIFLMGNHEFKLLEAWEGKIQAKEFLCNYGFKETLESYMGKKLSMKQSNKILQTGKFKEVLKKHYQFYKSLKYFYEEGDFFIVHAGIPLDSSGRFCLKSKEKIVFVRDEYLKIKKKFRNKIVIFGHTGFQEVFWDGFKLGIDTGAAYFLKDGYGRLSAVRLETFECFDHLGGRLKLNKIYSEN